MTGEWTPLLPLAKARCRKQFVPAHAGSDTRVHRDTRHFLQLASWSFTRWPFFEIWMTELLGFGKPAESSHCFLFLYILCNTYTFIKGQKTTIHRKTYTNSGKFRTSSGPLLAVVPWHHTDTTQQHYSPITTNAQKPMGLSNQTPI